MRRRWSRSPTTTRSSTTRPSSSSTICSSARPRRTTRSVYYVYGLIYDKTNRPERAELAYQKAVGLDPNHAERARQPRRPPAEERAVRRSRADVRDADRPVQPQGRGDADVARLRVSRDAPPTITRVGERDQYVAQGRGRVQARDPGERELRPGLLQPRPALPRRTLRSPASRTRSTPSQRREGVLRQYKNMPGVDIKLYDDAHEGRHEAHQAPREAEQEKEVTIRNPMRTTLVLLSVTGRLCSRRSAERACRGLPG